jgi:Uma2 family endonuclease
VLTPEAASADYDSYRSSTRVAREAGDLLQEHLDLVELVSGELQLRGPLCPDFVAELRSSSDPLATLKAKMREYVQNGPRLRWLLDSEERKAHVCL